MSEPLYPSQSRPPVREVPLCFQSEANLPGVDKPIGRDISALATLGCTLFCATDETATIERLTYDPQSGSYSGHQHIALSDAFALPGGPDDEIDIEGLAIHNGMLWITASHSMKRSKPDTDNPRLEDLGQVKWDTNRGFLGCWPLVETAAGVFEPAMAGTGMKPGQDAAPARMMRMGKKGKKGLRTLLKSDPLLQPFMKVPAKENGFDIEGMAIVGNRVVLGLRGPVLGKKALLLSLQLAEGADGFLQPLDSGGLSYRLHAIDLQGFGIRDLLADGDRLLILAGATQAIEGIQRVYAVEHFDPDCDIVSPDQVTTALTLPLRDRCDHAEGIARVELDGQALLAVAYDSPAAHRYDAQQHRLLLDAFPFPLP